MKIIIYSANINNYDYFYHPKNNHIEHYLFTDNNYFKSNIWNVININSLKSKKLDSRRIARYFKINSHLVLPPHNISIWLDHCFKFKIDDINKLISELNFNVDNNNNIMCYSHDQRSCIYEEAKICIKNKLDNESIIQNQIKKYELEGFPRNFGLFSSGLIVRKNNNITNKFNELWWEEVSNGSGRDQLSQCYASWKLNININPILIGKNIYNNPYLTDKVKHNHKIVY